MNFKIAVIEFDYHAEVLLNTCKILYNSPFDVNIYASEKIANEVLNKNYKKRYHWYIKDNNQSLKTFFSIYFNELNSNDLIIFNTIASHYKLFNSLDFKPPTILRIHNANSYLSPQNNFKPVFKPYFIWKDSSHIIRNTIFRLDWYYRKKLLKKINYLCFPDSKILEYANSEKLTENIKTCPVLPLTYYQGKRNTNEINNDAIHITIPGLIDQRRRNYEEIINAFGSITDKIKVPVVFSLLGRPKDAYGKLILRKASSLGKENFKVRTFNKKVPFDLFSSILAETDFLLLPIVIDTRYQIYKEKYGYTKISGSINDMISTGKPAIITGKYPLNKHLNQISIQYNSVEELCNLLLKWINKKEYINYANKVDDALSFYSKENITSYYTRILNQIINKAN